MSKDKNYAFNLDDENPDPGKNEDDDFSFEGEIPEKIEWLDDVLGDDLMEDDDDFDSDIGELEDY